MQLLGHRLGAIRDDRDVGSLSFVFSYGIALLRLAVGCDCALHLHLGIDARLLLR